MSSCLSPSEIYAINFQNPEPAFYSRVPHIIDHLTYDETDAEGKTTKKRLSINAQHLYRVLKSIAGEEGACWQSTANLSELSNMSVGAISNAKKELQQKFHQLDGNSLINVEKRHKKNDVNGTIYHIITIIDIWKWNRAFMATRKFLKKPEPPEIPKAEARSCGESAGGARSCGESALQGARSCGERNNNPNNKNPLSKEQQPTKPEPAKEPGIQDSSELSKDVVFSHTKKRLFVSSVQEKAYDWLIKWGCHETTAFNISTTYPVDDIAAASQYTMQRMKIKKPDDPLAYFHSVLKNRWWEES